MATAAKAAAEQSGAERHREMCPKSQWKRAEERGEPVKLPKLRVQSQSTASAARDAASRSVSMYVWGVGWGVVCVCVCSEMCNFTPSVCRGVATWVLCSFFRCCCNCESESPPTTSSWSEVNWSEVCLVNVRLDYNNSNNKSNSNSNMRNSNTSNNTGNKTAVARYPMMSFLLHLVRYFLLSVCLRVFVVVVVVVVVVGCSKKTKDLNDKPDD